MRRALIASPLLLLCLLCLDLGTAHAAPAIEGQAKAIEQRVLAPCCWTQTLDVHDSPLVTELRGEIRQRLTGGESALAIEDSFAARYGERVRALPRGKDPLVTVAQVSVAGLLVALGLLFALAQRWRTRRPSSTSSAGADDAALDAALDRALADPRL